MQKAYGVHGTDWDRRCSLPKKARLLGKMLQAYSPNQSDALIYTQHLEGGYALIKARSQRFPDDATTKRMTQLLRPQSVRGFSFVETRLVPEELVQSLRSSRSTTDADDKRPLQAALVGELETIWKQVAHASATVAPLQAQANRLLSLELEDLAAIQEILDVLDRAEGAEKLIKQDLSLMDLRLVQRELYYAPTDPFDPDSAEAWSGPILEHKSTAISGVLNKWRACRLVLICITMRCKYWLHGVGYRDYMPYDRDYDYNEVQQQVDEICANVPFMMGLDLDALVSFQPSTKTRTRHHGGGALMVCPFLSIAIDRQFGKTNDLPRSCGACSSVSTSPACLSSRSRGSDHVCSSLPIISGSAMPGSWRVGSCLSWVTRRAAGKTSLRSSAGGKIDLEAASRSLIRQPITIFMSGQCCEAVLGLFVRAQASVVQGASMILRNLIPDIRRNCRPL